MDVVLLTQIILGSVLQFGRPLEMSGYSILYCAAFFSGYGHITEWPYHLLLVVMFTIHPPLGTIVISLAHHNLNARL